MKNCIKSQKMFLDALYGDIGSKDKTWFEEHLRECRNCAEEFAETSSTVDIMNMRETSDPGEEFWNDYWDKLSVKLEKPEKPDILVKSLWDNILHKAVFNPKLIYYPAAAIVLLMVGIFLGRMAFIPVNDLQDSNAVDPVKQMIIDEKVNAYLDRSKVILSSFENFDPDIEDIFGLDLQGQSRVSQLLVDDAQSIRTGLAELGKEKLLELIIDLQVTLLKISQLEQSAGKLEIELIRSSIRNSALLLKINVEQINRYVVEMPAEDVRHN